MIKCESCFKEFNEKYKVCPYCGHYDDAKENPPYRLSHGTILNNRYKVGATLGVGGFGITYKAWDMKLQREVAIKEFYYAEIVNRAPGTKNVILVAKSYKEIYISGYNRLLDEARYVSKIQNKKNIVDVFEYFEENNTSYMVMEYIKGRQLKDVILENGKLCVEDAVNIISQACIALKITHKNKIIHRDIAPDNIMVIGDLKTEPDVRLIDFGAAKFSGGEEPVDRVIKPGFAPPEQYEGSSRQGEWTDVYGIGATLYYVLTGIKPQDSQERKEQDNLLSPHEIDPNIPENISNAVMRAMALEVHERFSDIDRFREAIQGTRKVQNLAKYRKTRNKRKYMGIAVAILIVALCGMLVGQNYISKKKDATLSPAMINVWIVDNGEENKEKALQSVADSFMQAYSSVKVNVVAVSEDGYEEKLLEAKQKKDMPEIFEVVKNNNDIAVNDVSEPVKISKNSIWFYDELFGCAKNKGIIILGFEIPVFYVNTTQYKGNAGDYKSVINELETSGKKNYLDRGKFLSGENVGYIGTSSDYGDVQKALPAQYKMLQLPGTLNCNGKYGFALSDCRNNEKKAAERFLEFMYSDSAQDIIFIQNNISALPVNKNVLELFEQVYTEYMGFFNEVDSYKLSE